MMKFINYRKVCSLFDVRYASLHASLEAEAKSKKGFLKNNRWRFNNKAKGLIVFAIIAVMLVSVFAFLPKGNNTVPNVPQSSDSPTASPSTTPQETNPTNNPTNKPDPISQITRNIIAWGGDVAQVLTPAKPPGTIESAETMNSDVWRAVAANAWKYFQPGTGVDANTGLPYAGGTDSPNFTDWDLGVYIQAVIDANKTGLIGTDGDWNSSARLEKVVSFLETRDLNSYNYPYWFYQARDGKNFKANSDSATGPVDGVDTGRLFVALNNLRQFNISLASRINNLVLHGRSNYAALVPNIKTESLNSNSIYFYYVASGFASFWPNELSSAPSQILTNILSSGNVTTNGVWLPKASILGDPLLCSVFEIGNNSQLMSITKQVYLAHEAYYNATGQYRAFSEGASLSDRWNYEWVALSDGRTWATLDESGSNYSITPVIYTKISVGFLAIYNTTFARNMTIYLEQTLPDPTRGYCEGVDESGAHLEGVGLNTNGLILGAAKYAIQNNP
jgi:hypothetical protein